MNPTKNLGGRVEAKVRCDKRIRHGLNSKAVKQYRKLDREFQNTKQPSADMIRNLCAALDNAVVQVLPSLDPNDPASNDYLNPHFPDGSRNSWSDRTFPYIITAS